MSLFVQLDAEYDSDDKIIEAGPMAELLFIRALVFCKRKENDGELRTAQLAIIGRGIPNASKHAAALVEVGLWLTIDGGWQVRNYLKRNRSSADIQAQRDLASEAGVRGNHERWHVGPEGTPSAKCRICRSERIGLPDRVGIGSLSPESKPEPEPYPKSSPSSDLSTDQRDEETPGDNFDIIVNRIVYNRDQRYNVPKRNPAAWRTKVRTSIIEEHSDRIRDYMTRYPDAPYDVIAAAVEGDTHSLGHYQTLGTGS